MKHCLKNFPVCSFLGHFFGHDVIYLNNRECFFLPKITLEKPLARVISVCFANFSACKSSFQECFYLYDPGFQVVFLVLFFIEQVVGKVLFLTKWESIEPSNLIWSCTILIRSKIFSKKLDDVVINFDDFTIY